MPAVRSEPAPQATVSARRLRVLVWPIDPGNPYTVALYNNMGCNVTVDAYSPGRLRHRYDIWHIHWPESLLNIRNRGKAAFKLAVFLAMIDLVWLRGGKIVWTVHNLQAHDALHPGLEAWFYRRFVGRLDGVISLSRTGLQMAREKFAQLRGLPAAVIPHGHYRGEYPPCRVDAKAALGIPARSRVILFFGEVRPYKNVEALIQAFRGVKDKDRTLLIAGRPRNHAIVEIVAQEAAQDERVRLKLQFIHNDDVAQYFEAAELVVLPYRRILNSGAALLSLSFSRPVLVPDLGAMGDLKQDFGREWVRTYAGEISTETLHAALKWAAEPRPSTCAMPGNYEWHEIRTQTLRFYQSVIASAVSA